MGNETRRVMTCTTCWHQFESINPAAHKHAKHQHIFCPNCGELRLFIPTDFEYNRGNFMENETHDAMVCSYCGYESNFTVTEERELRCPKCGLIKLFYPVTFERENNDDTIKINSKPDPALLPWAGIEQVLDLLHEGMKNHDPHGWKNQPVEEIEASLARHFIKFMSGNEVDESGYSHMVCIASRALMLIERYEK